MPIVSKISKIELGPFCSTILKKYSSEVAQQYLSIVKKFIAQGELTETHLKQYIERLTKMNTKPSTISKHAGALEAYASALAAAQLNADT